jgi:peptide/nickel transport system permease protein
MSIQVQQAELATVAEVEAAPKTSTPRQPRFGGAVLTILLTNRKATVGAVILIAFALVGIFAPQIAPYDPKEFVARPHQAPSSEFWFGTDGSGKDVFSQTVWGTRLSFGTGALVGISVTFIGIVIGIASGYFGGRVDDILSLTTNVFLIIPGLPLIVILAAFLPASFLSIYGVLTVTGWAWGARVLRAQTLSLREKDFVGAAVVTGESSARIMFREILPNMLSISVAGMFGAVTYAIGAQAGLEFLGLGNPSNISWGTSLYWAQNNSGLITGSWWTFVPAGLSIALLAFSLSLINYAIDEVTNPRLRSQRDTQNALKKVNQRLGKSRATPVVRKHVETTNG